MRLNCFWQPKINAILKSKDLFSMDFASLFGKFQESKIEVNILVERKKKGDKKKK